MLNQKAVETLNFWNVEDVDADSLGGSHEEVELKAKA